jgi:hypothetical protein
VTRASVLLTAIRDTGEWPRRPGDLRITNRLVKRWGFARGEHDQYGNTWEAPTLRELRGLVDRRMPGIDWPPGMPAEWRGDVERQICAPFAPVEPRGGSHDRLN